MPALDTTLVMSDFPSIPRLLMDEMMTVPKTRPPIVSIVKYPSINPLKKDVAVPA